MECFPFESSKEEHTRYSTKTNDEMRMNMKMTNQQPEKRVMRVINRFCWQFLAWSRLLCFQTNIFLKNSITLDTLYIVKLYHIYILNYCMFCI